MKDNEGRSEQGRRMRPIGRKAKAAFFGGISLGLISALTIVAPGVQAANTAPTGITLAVADRDVPVNQGSITVSWNAVSGAVGYTVKAYFAGSTSLASQQTVVAPATSVVVDSLVGGQRYDITVATADGNGYGSESAKQSATALTVPSPPQSVSVTPASSTATIEWVRPTTEGGSPILNYEVYVDGTLNQTVSGSSLTASVADNTITVDQVSVRAINAVGSSNVSTTATTPGAPRSVSATANGSTVNVSWNAPLDNGGAAITGYDVALKSGQVTVSAVSVSITTATFSAVSSGTYVVEVRARNSAGAGALGADSVNVTAPSTSPSDPPSGGGGAPAPSPSPSPSPSEPPTPEPQPIPEDLAPGESQATIGGEPVVVENLTGDDTQSVRYSVGQTSLNATSRDAGGDAVANEGGSLAVRPGGSVDLGLTGLAPGSQMIVSLSAVSVVGDQIKLAPFLHRWLIETSSDVGEVIGTLVADDSGVIDDSVAIPESADPGDAAVEFAGVNSSGELFSLFVGVLLTSEPEPEPTFLIKGSRGLVRGKKGIQVSGETTGLQGAVVMPRFKFPGQASYRDGLARRTVAEDGTFSWQRRTGKKIYIIMQTEDGSVRSNRIIIRT